MKQGEIWFVKFSDDGVGHEYQKDRPALIIQSDKQIFKTNVFTVLPITSNIDRCRDEDIMILKDDDNRLRTDSVIKVHHIQTFDSSRFLKKIGRVNENILLEVKDYLKIHFDI